MCVPSQPPRSEKRSIYHRSNPHKGKAFDLSDYAPKEDAPVSLQNDKQSSNNCDPRSSKILSTSDLVSAVGQIWNYASDTLAVCEDKKNVKDNDSCSLRREDVVYSLQRPEKREGPASDYSKSARRILPMDKSEIGLLKVTQKISFGVPSGHNFTESLLRSFMQDRSNKPHKFLKDKGLSSSQIQYEIRNMYGWVNVMIPSRQNFIPTRLYYPLNMNKTGSRTTGEYCAQENSLCPSEIISGHASQPANNLAIDTDKSRSTSYAKDVAKTRLSKCSDFSELSDEVKAIASISPTTPCADHSSASIDGNFVERQPQQGGDELLLNERKQSEKSAAEGETKLELFSPASEKPHYALSKQDHAFAGGLAGICVSLCLHPVDTVKTVIQSCRVDQKSICLIGRSIVSERGLTGLYRGISSNIASSAPISGVYTFTYESVKASLIPIFPKEYVSFAHCISGGCASVATSFIFTPSERIKQQMQVGSHYQNCWNALVGIIGKGGLPSLYAGWGAVLCRNVPHSIIKFYAYENLKQLMISSPQSSSVSQPSTSQTLLCGGLAGSTAALFTTPFDVVKTRLQTQVPGSVSQYSSVFHAIQEIRKHEGLKGLYRGLTPRLVMYMTQGALFFTSYEFFKSLFALEVSEQSST